MLLCFTLRLKLEEACFDEDVLDYIYIIVVCLELFLFSFSIFISTVFLFSNGIFDMCLILGHQV